MRISLPVENGDTLQAIQGFLSKLLTENLVDLLLVPMRTLPWGGAITPALVSSPALLAQADPLAPVLPVNAAVLAGQVSVRKPRPRVAAVLRSCEARALVELVKLQQASLDDLLLVCVDCAGTYGVVEYQARKGCYAKLAGGIGRHQEELWRGLFAEAHQNPTSTDETLRQACKMCEQPFYDQAQVVIELLSSTLDQQIFITLPEAMGAKLGFSPVEAGPARRQGLDPLIQARTGRREVEFAAIRARMEGGTEKTPEKLSGVFATCIRCHNCMTVCPICYCKTCVFKSAVFDHDPMQYLAWARQKGACRMPADITLFHLTRLNHMALSCVGCGMCSEACPAELPVGTVFRAIGQRLQGVFNYLPGANLDEKPPLITFKADEWTAMGE
jgi:formate dehydrogenase (coenzyme F420) beta subunit